MATLATMQCARVLATALLCALGVGVLAACGDDAERSWTMFPAPLLTRDARLDFQRFVPPELRTTEVPVLFATTRAPAPEDYPERYTRHAGDATRLGVAQVQLGEPGWSFEQLVESDLTSTTESLRPARVAKVEEFGKLGSSEAERAFLAGIDQQVARSRSGEAVIYVPGYRATFDQVLVLMGGWAHYLGRASAVVAFSWPTGTSVWNYLVDCPRARVFVPDIARLISLVAQSQAKRINLIAFSCGSPLLAEALVELRNRHPEEDHAALQQRYRIANAIFVAADIDLQTFARNHLPALDAVSRRTEVYVSENDGALKFASLLSRASRLGRPRFDELTREELETLAGNERLVGIDVADVPGAHELRGMRGHGYFVANEKVSSDVLLSMIYPFDPAWRGLVHGPGRGLWTFPDDYSERVGATIYEHVPELRRDAP